MRFLRIGALGASGIAVALAASVSIGCGPQPAGQVSQAPASSTADLMKQRGLSEADVSAALKTYMPTGRKDEYFTFASGGHGGNMIVIGVPSMRILKYVGVFTPEPWQGYGYGDQSGEVLAMGSRFGKEMTWGDMHHPALSETAGDYDGKFVFVNDKANARIAVVDLHDFVTKQIVTSPLIQSDHGATFVTPNTEYVIETSQYPAPLGGGYAPIEEFQDKYRGAVIFWKFDRDKGRIDPAKSFAMELPPYMQDLADAGKLASDGWVFINSFNTEMSYGGTLEGNPPMESGASQNDMDYLHIINLQGRRGGRQGRQDQDDRRHGRDHAADGRTKRDCCTSWASPRARTASTSRRTARSSSFGEARHARHGLRVREDQGAHRRQEVRGQGPVRRPDPALRRTRSVGRSRSVSARCTRSSTTRATRTPRCSSSRPSPSGRSRTSRSSRRSRSTTTSATSSRPRATPSSPDGKYLIAMNKWAIDRFAKVGTAAAAELPAHRHQQRADAAALRHAASAR